MLPIVVNDLGPSLSAATIFLKGITPPPSKTPPKETPLLKQVRISLRGPDAEDTTIIHTHTEDSGERELTWSGSTAVLTQGGVIMKQWCFDAEEEAIQWACLGQLEQTIVEDVMTRTAANYITPEDPPPPPVTNGRPIFGPFARPNTVPKADKGKSVKEPAVFIFLRSTAKIYLSNGLDYTFSLPFVVRRAWPISPHGIMVQRVLDQYEIFEAGVNGDVPLPTIFSVTSPFSEAAVVGLTSGILGETRDLPPALKDADEHVNKPLKSIPPTDMIVWASRPSDSGDSHNVVTVDVEKGQLSVWQYVHIKPKDTPTPIDSTQCEARNAHKKRQSLSNRRTSAMFEGMGDPRHRMHAMSPLVGSQDLASTQIPDFPDPSDVVPLSSLPGMPPALSTTTTMASLVSGIMSSQSSLPKQGRRNSLVKNDLSMTMDRMALGGRLDSDATITPADQGKMTAAFWMTTLTTQSIEQEDAQSWQDIMVSLFDDRWDGQQRRCLMSISLPKSRRILILSLAQQEDRTTQVNLVSALSGLCATSLRATRANVWDLLVVRRPGDLVVLTHGLAEVPVTLQDPEEQKDAHTNTLFTASRIHTGGLIIKARNLRHGTVLLTRDDGSDTRATFDIFPQDALTNQCLQVLALILPAAEAFQVHSQFLANWSAKNWSTAQNVEFDCLASALYTIFQLQNEEVSVTPDPWLRLGQSDSHRRLCEDPALRGLRTPPTALPSRPIPSVLVPHPLLGPVVQGLHIMGESLRLLLHRHSDVLRFAPVICRLAMGVRPEWADYWKRLVPGAMAAWPTPATLNFETFEDRMPVWPADIASILHARLNNPDWKVPWHDMQHIVTRFDITPSLHYGLCDPLQELHELSLLYNTLSDRSIPDGQNRAENTILKMVTQNTSNLLPLLPLGMAAPLREAARSCQLSPPGNWPLEAYVAIGRNDLAASANQNPDLVFSDGYSSKKDFVVDKPRQTISQISLEARGQAGGEIDAVSGVELDQKEFTDIRFGQDRRLEEVARLLCSSTVPSVKSMDRPELSEHDQTKEHQNQVVRVAERTFALPYGRAMFTYGSVPKIAREAYLVPKIEYTVRVQPLNILVTPEPGKISPESICWGEFHNGVAAALRIAPGATGVESSWIAFNKPSDLSPEHAGFLLGLGLNGHLKEMLTWHTFSYLTPKHDLTSIGVLLGLSTANMGTANSHVTKLLAVHTPALLPTPSVDLNVSLLTQAAGLSGIGILYLGTRNRRMGEVCLSQISRKDLVQPDLSNEYREAYTYSTALAFGMIMLGKGSNIPADMLIVKRLHSLIHGGVNRMLGYGAKPAFDVNLTSPAASMGLGLMYLRTNRRDIADILTIPETVLELNSIQPTFLLVRTIARSLILWDQIKPSSEWMTAQVPGAIQRAVELRTKTGKRVDDAMDLAYYNILAGGCFAIGLKFAGTARQEAYQAIVRTYDLFSRLAYSTGPAFDVKIRRSAIRDGLNLISIALSMVMAGTGEVTCLRRLRYSYGMYQQMMYHQGFKYGVHAATHMAMGLLFLGGGRYTLGTSDAAIACMVTAFFPRFNHVSSDNKSYLQALRHLWVLAVEPRCLIARDVDTKEVVYLPVKIAMKGEPETAPSTLNSSAQLISPTLIPDIDNLKSIRVDTPRYWPFYLDTVTHTRHKEALLKSQTLYVKRRTAFLSYTEDPRGSRSLFVRSGASSFGDAAMLDFPQVPNTKIHPAGDMSEFITSFSNNILFLAFADHLARPSRSRSHGRGGEEDVPPEERIFHAYCHAALLDSIIQDKPETLQSHLTLYQYRKMDARSRYFHLRMQDLRFAADFYAGKVYEKRFGGTSPTNVRSGLLRETTVLGVLHTLDRKFEEIKAQFGVLGYVGRYARGEILPELPAPLSVMGMNVNPGSGSGEGRTDEELMTKFLAWYLLRNGVPSSTILVVMRSLGRDAHNQCLGRTPPDGTPDEYLLDMGIREVLHTTGNRMTSTHAIPWTVRSLDEVIDAWRGS